MKDYISENRTLIGTDDIARLAIQTSENTAAIAKINDEMLRKSIMHLRNVNPGVMITVFSDNKQSHLRRADLNDFRNELVS